MALLIYYSLGSAVLLASPLSSRSLIHMTFTKIHWQWAFLWDILRIGLSGSLITVFANLDIVFLTNLVALVDAFALVSYGIGARLEYWQIPLVFGFGSAPVTMVGTNIGTGPWHVRGA